MPKENKKRGRREENKRKHDGVQDSDPPVLKRHKTQDDLSDQVAEITVDGDTGDDYISFSLKPPTAAEDEPTFYGFLTEEEQEYYANVNNKLDADDFESAEDRANFIEAVHRESQGKEIKLASSQSCSRYLEKVISLSKAEQLRGLFQKFLESLTYLVQHRFGSHCVETLFLQAAKFLGQQGGKSEAGADEPTLEELFLRAAEELKPNMGYLLTEKFASHSVRLLLLVLSGEPLETASMKVMLASRKKEKLEVRRNEEDPVLDGQRKVPPAFKVALRDLIAAAISTLDTTYLRALATHPTGNPMLQLLLRLELISQHNTAVKDDKSLVRRLLPDESLEERSDSAKFIQGLLYDPTGSHLLEVMVQYLPGKSFKKLYKNLLQSRMGDMAKNDIASYVAIKIIGRLGKDDLEIVRDMILPEIPSLVARYRVALIKVLIERCHFRQVDMKPLAQAIREAYGNNPSATLVKMLKLDASPENAEPKSGKDSQPVQETTRHATDLHGSLLAQSMLQAPMVNEIVQESLLALPDDLLILLAKDSTASRILQVAVTAATSSLQFRRRLIPRFYGRMVEMSLDPAASHLADALWTATEGSQFMKERFASELAGKESSLRESRYGRSVWKNWSMDLYQRRFKEWQALAKGYDQKQEQPAEEEVGRKKTALELARERHAEKKIAGFQKQKAVWRASKMATSSNRTPLGATSELG